MKKLLIFFLPAILPRCDAPGTSGDIRGFRVCVSDDLVTWQKGDVVYDGNASAWGTDCFWAPEV